MSCTKQPQLTTQRFKCNTHFRSILRAYSGIVWGEGKCRSQNHMFCLQKEQCLLLVPAWCFLNPNLHLLQAQQSPQNYWPFSWSRLFNKKKWSSTPSFGVAASQLKTFPQEWGLQIWEAWDTWIRGMSHWNQAHTHHQVTSVIRGHKDNASWVMLYLSLPTLSL